MPLITCLGGSLASAWCGPSVPQAWPQPDRRPLMAADTWVSVGSGVSLRGPSVPAWVDGCVCMCVFVCVCMCVCVSVFLCV